MFRTLLIIAAGILGTATSAQAGLLHPQAAQATEAADPVSKLQLEDPKWGFALQLPGLSHHFDKPASGKRQWNERHPGLGIEWHSPSEPDGWHLKYTAGTMLDSVDSWELQAGATAQKTLYEFKGVRLDAGAGAFLFYRAMKFDGPRRLVPGVLPVASLLHTATGYGANIVYVPHIKMGHENLPSVLYIQLTKQF